MEGSLEDESAMYITQSPSCMIAVVTEDNEIAFSIRPHFSKLQKAFSVLSARSSKKVGYH